MEEKTANPTSDKDSDVHKKRFTDSDRYQQMLDTNFQNLIGSYIKNDETETSEMVTAGATS